MGLDWLNTCRKYKIEVVQAPENTSHFLKLYDSFVNKAFKANMNRFRDYMCSSQVVDTVTISFKLAAGVAGYLGIKPWIVRDSWKSVGLYPMDYRFLDKTRNHEEDLESVAILQRKSGPTDETTAILFGQDTLSNEK